MQYYGVDLRQLFHDDDPLSPNYVLTLVVNLPRDSALAASRRGGPQYRGWDEDRYALVAMVNAQRAANHMFLLAHSDPKKSKPKAPEPFPIPDNQSKSSRPKQGSFAAIAAQMLAAQRRQKGET